MRMFQKGKSWYVDHTYDDEKDTRNLDFDLQNDDISTISGGSEPPVYSKDRSLILETPQEKKLRKRSHWVAYATMFVMSIGFSVVLSGVWPYLQELDDTLTKESLGWVVAANPLGQMIASPIVGYLGNRLGSIRVVCYFTMTVFMLGNLIYGFLPAMTDWWDHSAFHIMIIARFIVGLSSANITLCRSYLAVASTSKERTTTMAIVSAFQSLGFVVGPVIQTVLSLTISDEMMTYRSCGWVAAALGLINFFILTPWVFQEYEISNKESKESWKGSDTKSSSSQRPDMTAIAGMLSAYFFSMMIFIFMETLSVPLVNDQYGWENDKSIVVVCLLTIGSMILATLVIFFLRKYLSKFEEKKILLMFGILPVAIGTFLYIPVYTDLPIPIQNCTLISSDFSSSHPSLSHSSANPWLTLNHLDTASPFHETRINDTTIEECSAGCPVVQTWCEDISQIPLAQFFIANFFIIVGFPVLSVLILGIYSKLVGTRPQGLWMSLLAVVLSLARIIGPICASYLYTRLGTIVSFGTLTIGMGIGMMSYIMIMHRLP